MAQLIEQPRILDGDYRLIGESFYKFDLFVAERPDISTTDRDGANSLVLSHKWDGQVRAVTRAQGYLGAVRELLGRSLEVMDVDWGASEHGASCDQTGTNRQIGNLERNWTIVSGDVEPIALAEKNMGIVCLTEPGRGLCQRIEHCLEIERRAANDLENVGG